MSHPIRLKAPLLTQPKLYDMEITCMHAVLIDFYRASFLFFRIISSHNTSILQIGCHDATTLYTMSEYIDCGPHIRLPGSE